MDNFTAEESVRRLSLHPTCSEHKQRVNDIGSNLKGTISNNSLIAILSLANW